MDFDLERIEATQEATWNPDDDSLELLGAAEEVIASVPYAVTLRFVFYRLWQEGRIRLGAYEGDKGTSDKRRAYEKLKKALAKARKAGMLDRRALADDTRNPLIPELWETTGAWHRAVADASCTLDPWAKQERRPRLLFEAEAMSRQFDYWAEPYRVELWPFRGDCSIDAKEALAEAMRNDRQATTLLYFGDYDPKGLAIARAGVGDVLLWAGREDAEAYRVGLTPEQVTAYALPENDDKPGTFQWEALADAEAGAIIRQALNRFPCENVAERERRATLLSAKALASLCGGF